MTAETSAARIRRWLPGARAAVKQGGQFHVLSGAGALLDDIERVLVYADAYAEDPETPLPAVCLDPCPSHLFRTWCILPTGHDEVLHTNGKGVSWQETNTPPALCGAVPPESVRELFPGRRNFRCLRTLGHPHEFHDDGHGLTWSDRHDAPAEGSQ